MKRAISEPRAWRAIDPGTSAIDGSSSHTATASPSAPTADPTTRSTMRAGPTGITAWMCDPATRPMAWPMKAPTTSTPAASNRRDDGVSKWKRSTTLGRKRAATARPSPRPIHDVTLVTKPMR